MLSLMTTEQTPQTGFQRDAMIAAQELSPYNVDDAEYIAAHPAEFSVELAAEARARLDETAP